MFRSQRTAGIEPLYLEPDLPAVSCSAWVKSEVNMWRFHTRKIAVEDDITSGGKENRVGGKERKDSEIAISSYMEILT